MTDEIKSANNATVFVVDDDCAVLNSLEELIASMSLASKCFSSAKEFLDAYDDSKHGCLVLDVRMPDISGIELHEYLTANEILIPVIVITGHGDIAMCAREMKRGAVDFLEKPYRPAELCDSIRRAIQIDITNRNRNRSRAGVIQKLRKLAPRELSVLKELMKGKQNKEVAAALDLSRRTVQLRRSSLMQKLSVESTAELLAMLAPVWSDDFDLPHSI